VQAEIDLAIADLSNANEAKEQGAIGRDGLPPSNDAGSCAKQHFITTYINLQTLC